MCVWTIQHGHSAICYHFQGKRPDAGNYFGCPNYFFVFFDVYVSTWNFALLSWLKFRILLFRVCMCVGGFFPFEVPFFCVSDFFWNAIFISRQTSALPTTATISFYTKRTRMLHVSFSLFSSLSTSRERDRVEKNTPIHTLSPVNCAFSTVINHYFLRNLNSFNTGI